MNKRKDNADVFKVLSHDIRRRILKFIGDVERATFTDLSKIEPKPGKLYYHLKVLGDLVKQNEDGSYSLTEYGYKVYQLMLEGGAIPEQKGNRRSLNLNVGKVVYKLSEDATIITDVLLVVFIFYASYALNLAVLPFYIYRFDDSVIVTAALVAFAISLLGFYLKIERRFEKEIFIRAITGFVYSLVLFSAPFFIMDYLGILTKIIYYILTLVLQVLSLLFFTSSLSFVLKKSFTRSLVIPLLLHYVSSFILVFRILNFS